MPEHARLQSEQERVDATYDWISELASEVEQEDRAEDQRREKLQEIKDVLEDALDESATHHAKNVFGLAAELGHVPSASDVEHMIDDVVADAVKNSNIPEKLKPRVLGENALKLVAARRLAEAIAEELPSFGNDLEKISAVEKTVELLEAKANKKAA